MDAISAFFLAVVAVLFAPHSAYLISLPHGAHAESVTHLQDNTFLTVDINTGALLLLDALQLQAYQITPPLQSSPPVAPVALGLFANPTYVVVAGAVATFDRPPRVYCFERSSFHLFAMCDIPTAALLNDVVADDFFAYITDSFIPVVYRVSLNDLPRCVVNVIPLPEEIFTQGSDGRARSNGIALFEDGLLIANTDLGAVYFVSLSEDEDERLVVYPIAPPGYMTNADGIVVTDNLLFVSQPADNLVSVWHVARDPYGDVVAAQLDLVQSAQFENPSSVAVGPGLLVAPNLNKSAPFGVPPEVPFSVVALPYHVPLE